jgi:hypothetical protein
MTPKGAPTSSNLFLYAVAELKGNSPAVSGHTID